MVGPPAEAAPRLDHKPEPTVNEYAAAKEGLHPGYPANYAGRVSSKPQKVEPPTVREDLDDEIPF